MNATQKLYRETNEERGRDLLSFLYFFFFLPAAPSSLNKEKRGMPADTTALPCPPSIITTSPMPPYIRESLPPSYNIPVCVRSWKQSRKTRNMAARVFLLKKKKKKKNLTVQCLFGAPIALGFFFVVFAIRVVVVLLNK